MLGVEGVSDEIIISALINAGCTANEEKASTKKVTKTDFFTLGLTGQQSSSEKRKELCRKLSLPSKISANMLIDSINSLMTSSEFFNLFDNNGNLL